MATAEQIIQLLMDENRPMTLEEIEQKLNEPAETFMDDLISRGYLFKKTIDSASVYTTTTMAKSQLVRPLDDLRDADPRSL